MPRTALVPIADGSEELEAVTIIDVLRRAGVEVTVASVDALQITASRRTTLVADRRIGECLSETYDLIALPGGMPGAERLRDSVDLTTLLKRQRDEGRLYAAICASPAVVLETHGLLAGRKATCYPSFAETLTTADASGAPVVVDGPCITSRGPGTAIPFALALVRALCGENAAEVVAEAMLVD